MLLKLSTRKETEKSLKRNLLRTPWTASSYLICSNLKGLNYTDSQRINEKLNLVSWQYCLVCLVFTSLHVTFEIRYVPKSRLNCPVKQSCLTLQDGDEWKIFIMLKGREINYKVSITNTDLRLNQGNFFNVWIRPFKTFKIIIQKTYSPFFVSFLLLPDKTGELMLSWYLVSMI